MKIRLCPLLFWVVIAFVWSYCAKQSSSALTLTLLVECQEGHLACKNFTSAIHKGTSEDLLATEPNLE